MIFDPEKSLIVSIANQDDIGIGVDEVLLLRIH